LTIPQIISLTIILFVIVLSFKKGTDLLSPARVFILVWSVCILLVEFKFSGFQHQWTAFSWFVLLSGLVSFLAGLFISYSLRANTKILAINEIRNRILVNKDIDKQKLFIIISLLFTAYIVSLTLEFIIEGYIPLFHPRPDRARIDFGVFGIHLIVSQMPVILFLIVEYFILGSESKRKSIVVILFFIIIFTTYFLILQRFNYILWLIMTFALLYYATKKINFRNVVLLTVIFISFLSALTSIRVSQYATNYLYLVSKMKFSVDYAEFTGPYMYIVMNLENQARAIEKLENHTYSAITFDWLYAISGIKYWMQEYFNIIPRPFLTSSYNTFPFMWDYFYDFGLIGVVLFSLLTGIALGYLYYYMRRKGTLDGIIYYGVCLFFIIISFFTNIFSMLNIVVSFFLLWLIHKFFIRGTRSASNG
jgi:oligosaccharide repeat unit polymerase